jgi:hypothetical protein
MKKLENFKWQVRWISDLASLKSCLDYLGIDVSDGWLYGASGHAFAINIHDELCPSGPTAWRKEQIYKFAQNVGCNIKLLYAFSDSPDFAECQKKAWEEVKKAIDDGLPCYGWEFDIPEYYIIDGYDGENYLYSGYGQQQGTKRWNELGTSQIGVLENHIVSPAQPADDKETIRQALQFAIEQTKSPQKYTFDNVYKCGLNGYDQWLKTLDTGRVSAGGLAFNIQCWGECRQNALPFLKEAKERISTNGSISFDEAIQNIETVAQEFGGLQKQFAFSPEDFEKPLTDEKLLNEASGALQKTRQAEAAALAEFEKIVAAL